jgi:DNA modification methylase
MKPYYQDEWVTIYHGDCREILPELPKVDLVLTDPPYPDYHVELYQYEDGLLDILKEIDCRQLIFWSAKVDFPLDYTAIHIWDKLYPIAGYERLFERNGRKNYLIFRSNSLCNPMSAQMALDKFYGHPSQKPQKLISELITSFSHNDDLILDLFHGVGTTAYCAKKLNRKCIGIEIAEKYCEIAAKRCSQGVFDLR